MSENMMLPQPPEQMPERYMPPPKVMKVLGIIDFVIARVSIIMMLCGLALTLMISSRVYTLYSDFNSLSGFEDEVKALSVFALVFVVNGIVMILLCVMLLQACRELKKGTDKGRILSNRYAWTSIVSKVFLIGISIYADTNFPNFQDLSLTGEGASYTPPKVLSVNEIVETLMWYFISIIYPVLCLILLNRKSLKDYLRERENSPIVSE